MSNNKQSSVEWLWDKFVNKPLKISDLVKLLEQAKAMHKEEIKTSMSVAFLDGLRIGDENYKSPHEEWDEYYNETFGGNK
jgi:hypothetical protein